MRVMLCRARPDSEATAAKLVGAGHEAVIAPVLEILRLEATLPDPRPDATLMTSAHAADCLTDAQAERLSPLPLYAVGRRTAAQARRRGFADIRVGHGDAASLASLLALTLPAPARLLYLAGRVRKPDPESGLARSGYALSVIELYDAAAASSWADWVVAELNAGRIDVCLHYSRRSAELALRFATQGEAAAAFRALRHICISEDAATPLRQAGVGVVSVATTPDEGGMLGALAAGASAT